MNHLGQGVRIPVALLIGAMMATGCRTTQPDQQETSFVKAETDDSQTDKTAALVSSDPKTEAWINKILDEARAQTKPESGWDDAAKQRLLRAVYDLLGADSPGSGIRPLPGGPEVSPVSRVEQWLGFEGLDPAVPEVVHLKFGETIYRNNDIDLVNGKVMSHKTQQAADHSIAPVIRVGGVLMGTDKVGHFFMQGYWYWHAGLHNLRSRCEYGQYMEGNPILFEERWRKYRELSKAWIAGFRFGYFGAWATGVISLADGEANEAGYQFYKQLFADPDNYKFRWSHYARHLPFMNENNNPSKFAHGISVEAPARSGERPKDSCWQYDRFFD